MRLGVFGGSFDPVHLGHLILAEQCREQARLDQVLFVPAARPPHKQGRALTPFLQRAEMLALAIAGHAAFQVCEIEKDRPGPSYTVDTLAALQILHPDAELFLLVGTDMARDLPSWYQPVRILELATLVSVGRPGAEVAGLEEVQRKVSLPEGRPLRHQLVQAPLIEISGTDIRRRVAAGHTIRYLVPRAVEVYIQDKQLYRND
jgi:nicotinate-nucleotide adenylyltransferase